jgi:hypothetical protein
LPADRRRPAGPAAAQAAAAALLAGAASFAGTALTGCGGESVDIAPLRLKHSPPIAQLSADQLRSLSMECDGYSPHDGMRGRYDAAYCEAAMAAWSDAPLQMVTVRP